MKVLFIGDVIGEPGCFYVAEVLKKIKDEIKPDLIIANAENSANGNGTTKASAKFLLDCGCNVLTGGNHSLRNFSFYETLNENGRILRPENISKHCPGVGVCVIEELDVAVVNLIGQVFLDANSSPFETSEMLLKKIKNKIIIVDFHAEATGEKGALANFLDGKVSVVVGTHTHVQTNDCRILEKGTGFISDVGMVGPSDSILGVNKERIINRMITKTFVRFEIDQSDCIFNSILCEIDEKDGKCKKIETFNLKQKSEEK